MKWLFILLFAGLLIYIIPIIGIWSLNTLFHLEIETNLSTWFACLFLMMCVHGSTRSK